MSAACRGHYTGVGTSQPCSISLRPSAPICPLFHFVPHFIAYLVHFGLLARRAAKKARSQRHSRFHIDTLPLPPVRPCLASNTAGS